MHSALHSFRFAFIPLCSAFIPQCIHSAVDAFRFACIPQCIHSAVDAFRSAFIPQCIHSAVHAFRFACIPQCIHSAVDAFRSEFIPQCMHPAVKLKGGIATHASPLWLWADARRTSEVLRGCYEAPLCAWRTQRGVTLHAATPQQYSTAILHSYTLQPNAHCLTARVSSNAVLRERAYGVRWSHNQIFYNDP